MFVVFSVLVPFTIFVFVCFPSLTVSIKSWRLFIVSASSVFASSNRIKFDKKNQSLKRNALWCSLTSLWLLKIWLKQHLETFATSLFPQKQDWMITLTLHMLSETCHIYLKKCKTRFLSSIFLLKFLNFFRRILRSSRWRSCDFCLHHCSDFLMWVFKAGLLSHGGQSRLWHQPSVVQRDYKKVFGTSPSQMFSWWGSPHIYWRKPQEALKGKRYLLICFRPSPVVMSSGWWWIQAGGELPGGLFVVLKLLWFWVLFLSFVSCK